jgi:hypothetical protein
MPPGPTPTPASKPAVVTKFTPRSPFVVSLWTTPFSLAAYSVPPLETAAVGNPSSASYVQTGSGARRPGVGVGLSVAVGSGVGLSVAVDPGVGLSVAVDPGDCVGDGLSVGERASVLVASASLRRRQPAVPVVRRPAAARKSRR